uniref:Reverse transcriptase domain-containing protein n=1 Tax=Aegilops tauschii subsp. strangulata TaxID=200361 RepID=A0A453BHG6_AEGTS
GPPIWHRKGLRQGDPVSPQLFVLAVDTLARLIKRVVDMGIMAQLHPTRSIPAVSLYANDAVLFCHCSPSDIIAVREVLALFGRTSGLMVNYAKSSASLLHCDTDEATTALAHLGCPIVDLSITYLGIPLIIGQRTAAQLQPLVDGIAGRLPTWKAHLMNKTGRFAMVKSVLSAIPVHQLLAYAPPKKTLRQIEKIERGFLWAGRGAANGGHCHVNWRRVCRPISHGGLGVQDLERARLALRL